MTRSHLDARQANVVCGCVPIGDYPDGEYNVGRGYYWYDRDGKLPSIEDYEFRAQHPEFTDDEWRILLHEALNRGRQLGGQSNAYRRSGESSVI